MKIYSEIYTLEQFSPWSEAVYTYNKLIEADKSEEFIQRLDDIYPDGITETQLNDILWFEEEWCYDIVGLNKHGFEPIHADDFIGESSTLQNAIADLVKGYIASDENTDDYTEADFEDLDPYHFEQEIDDWIDDNIVEDTDYDTIVQMWLDDVGRDHIKLAVEMWHD